MSKLPILLWIRRDLRLSDHPALQAACSTGRPVVPVFILDDETKAMGAAPKWRLGLGLEHFSDRLKQVGSRLLLRRGPALEVLQSLIAETGATDVFWTRSYYPAAMTRDAQVKSELRKQGINARSFGGHLLFEPLSVTTGSGGFYRVFTPFWKTVRNRAPEAPIPAPVTISAPAKWPLSDTLADWQMGHAMARGATIVRPHLKLGEEAARERLDCFIQGSVEHYSMKRDFPGVDGTSNLSENLAYGEISPHQCWFAGQHAMACGKAGAETFLKELVWREFAYHLMYHTPHMLTGCWRPEWEAFPWRQDPNHPHYQAWIRGRTGVPFVDAAMRELYVTGRIHNRARMVAASYLTKHLMTHWKLGMSWFENCLVDWDPASNAMGWQWVAGCGPDAAPYFRIFNPLSQRVKFDPEQKYVQRWLAEGQPRPGADAHAFFDAVPFGWKMDPRDPYPNPVVDMAEGRSTALKAYENKDF